MGSLIYAHLHRGCIICRAPRSEIAGYQKPTHKKTAGEAEGMAAKDHKEIRWLKF
jgi:hypothetical protein